MKIVFFSVLLLISSLSFAGDTHKTIHVDVNGLVCDFCARAVEKVFKKQDAVASIKVDLSDKQIKVRLNDGHSLTDEKVEELVTDSGYDVVGIHRE